MVSKEKEQAYRAAIRAIQDTINHKPPPLDFYDLPRWSQRRWTANQCIESIKNRMLQDMVMASNPEIKNKRFSTKGPLSVNG